MPLEPGTIVVIGLAAAGALVWFVRLEGRVNLNERRTDDIHDDLGEIKDDIKTLLSRSYGARSTDK